MDATAGDVETGVEAEPRWSDGGHDRERSGSEGLADGVGRDDLERRSDNSAAHEKERTLSAWT